MEVVERGVGAAQAGLAGYLLLVDRRLELLWAVAGRSPLGRDQLPEGLPPGSLMRRGYQHPVDVEDRAPEPERHAPASPTAHPNRASLRLRRIVSTPPDYYVASPRCRANTIAAASIKKSRTAAAAGMPPTKEEPVERRGHAGY